MAMNTRVRDLVAMTSVGCAVGLGCGGGAPEPASARSSDTEAEGPASGSPDEGSPSASDPGEAAVAKRAACDDGSCTPCGDSQCPSGWYCDESAKGGPACGWLPECANKLSCGCLGKTFSSCQCEEKSGGVHLSCG